MNRAQNYKIALSVLLGYFLTAIAVTFPLIFNLFDHVPYIPGDTCDADGIMWLYWWTKKAFLKPNFFHSNMQFFPAGKNLFICVGGFLNPILFLPFQHIFGLIGSYNLTIFFWIILAGYGTYLLVNHFTGDKATSFICGFIFIFNPLFLSVIAKGLNEQMPAGLIPLYILYLFKTSEGKYLKNLVWAIISLLLATFSGLQHSLFLFLFTLSFLVYKRNKDVLKKVILLWIISLLIASPYFFIYTKNWLENRMPGFSQFKFPILLNNSKTLPSNIQPINYILEFSTDLKGFFLRKTRWSFFNSFLVISLFFYSFFLKKKPKFWIFSTLFFFILSLGPYLKVGNKFQFGHMDLAIPLPYLFLHNFFPFFSRFHWPSRFLIMSTLSLVVASGFSLQRILSLLRSKHLKRIAIGFIIFLLLLEKPRSIQGSFPIQLRKIEVPDFYYKLGQEADCAIIKYPFSFFGHDGGGIHNFYQTIHQKKMLGGLIAPFLFPLEQKKFIESNTFLQYLLLLQEDIQDAIYLKRQELEKLNQLGFKYLIVHGEELVPAKRNLLAESLKPILGEPKEYNGGIFVYCLSSTNSDLNQRQN